MQVPTGGIARERESVDPVNLNDSGADSIVWMKEDDGTVILIDECSA